MFRLIRYPTYPPALNPQPEPPGIRLNPQPEPPGIAALFSYFPLPPVRW